MQYEKTRPERKTRYPRRKAENIPIKDTGFFKAMKSNLNLLIRIHILNRTRQGRYESGRKIFCPAIDWRYCLNERDGNNANISLK